jgi:hypothetical protein
MVAVTNDQRENLPAGRFAFTLVHVALPKMSTPGHKLLLNNL